MVHNICHFYNNNFPSTTTAGHFTRGHTLSPSSEQVISLYFLTSSMYAFHADDLSSAWQKNKSKKLTVDYTK